MKRKHVIFILTLSILSSLAAGLGIRLIALWISTGIFMTRILGNVVKVKNLIILETICMVLSLLVALMMKKVDWTNVLLFAFLRSIFLLAATVIQERYLFISEEIMLDMNQKTKGRGK